MPLILWQEVMMVWSQSHQMKSTKRGPNIALVKKNIFSASIGLSSTSFPSHFLAHLGHTENINHMYIFPYSNSKGVLLQLSTWGRKVVKMCQRSRIMPLKV